MSKNIEMQVLGESGYETIYPVVTTVLEQNKNLQQKFWRGTQAEYDAIQNKDANTMYIVKDASGEPIQSGDMLKSVYDRQKRNTDIFEYVDNHATNIPITSNPADNVKIWIDPNEEGEGGGTNIPAQDTEPATGNYWLDTSAEGGTYYTAGEVDELLQRKANSLDVYTKDEVDTLFQEKGSHAEVHVIADVGTTVTMSRSGKTLTATVGSDRNAILYPTELGEWTIVYIFDGSQKTITYTLEVIGIVYVYPLVVGATLNNTTWEAINMVSEVGTAKQFWSVGDTKTISVNGTNYEFQIIGFNHDDKTAGGKAGITFQMVDCLSTIYNMNSSNTNNGGWKNSGMRSCMPTFLSQLPSDLQSVIKPVNKLTSVGNNTSTIETVSDKLFLLSEVEIFGSSSHSFAGEGSQYDWYKAGNTKVKKVNGSANNWWERSPYRGNASNFCFVQSSGGANFGGAQLNYGVSFAFCV